LESTTHIADIAVRSSRVSPISALIINADDWGGDKDSTNRIAECAAHGTVSSASAMVFMEDSERAAEIARQHKIDAGLHLNFTTPFSSSSVPSRVVEHQQRTSRFLGGNRLAQVVYHPGLSASFRYLVASQVDEFERIYGEPPRRVDGHHHMHLCANVLLGKLLPAGTIARRNFTFESSEKGFLNRGYRNCIDRILAKRHFLTDFFYSLPPLEVPGRLEKIIGLAAGNVVEVETHPINDAEHSFLMRDDTCCAMARGSIASFRCAFEKAACKE